MPPLTKQLISIRPQGVDQRTAQELLPPGKLTRAEDVHQPVPGQLSKRNGMFELPSGAVGVSFDTAPDSGRDLISTGDHLFLRTQQRFQSFAESAKSGSNLAGGAWHWLQNTRHCHVPPAPTVMSHGYRPICVQANGMNWWFAADLTQQTVAQPDEQQIGNGNSLGGTSQSSWWYYRVTDATTGAEIVRSAALSAGSILVGWMIKAVVVGNRVFVFIGAKGSDHTIATKGRFITCIFYDATQPWAGGALAFEYDAGANNLIHGFDVIAKPDGSQLIMVVAGNTLAKTGGGTANGVVVTIDPNNLGAGYTAHGVAVPTYNNQCHVAIAKNCITALNALVWITSGGGNVSNVNETDLSVYGLIHSNNLSDNLTCNILACLVVSTLIYTWNNTTVGEATVMTVASSYLIATGAAVSIGVNLEGVPGRNRLSVLSEPFPFDGVSAFGAGGGTFGIIVVYDDSLRHTQAAFYLMDAITGQLMARALRGSAGDSAGRSCFQTSPSNLGGYLAAPIVDSNGVTIALNSWDGQQYVTKAVRFSLLDKLANPDRSGPMMPLGNGRGVAIPSGYPVALHGEQVVELGGPPMSPANITVNQVASVQGAPAGMPQAFYGVCYTWVFRDSNGDIYQSAPSPVATIQINAGNKTIQIVADQLTIDNEKFGMSILNAALASGTIPGRGYGVRIYLTQGQTTQAAALVAPLLGQFTIDNQPSLLTFAITLAQLDTFAGVGNEQLYTQFGAELPNDPAPPYGWAATWRDRTLLGDTDQAGELWVSKEKEIGIGWSFSLGLTGQAGTSRNRAGGQIDFDRFAIFAEDGIYLISGPGPDKLGAGFYEPVKLPSNVTCWNPRSVCTTPLGLIFQGTSLAGQPSDISDGSIYLLGRELRITRVSDGADSFRTRPVTSATYVPETNQVRILMRDLQTEQSQFFLQLNAPGVSGLTERLLSFIGVAKKTLDDNSTRDFVVIAGGEDTDVSAARGDGRLFDSATFEFQQIPDRPQGGITNVAGGGNCVGRFANGDLLTLGGDDANFNPTQKCYRYIAQQNRWQVSPVFPDYPDATGTANDFYGWGLPNGDFIACTTKTSYLWSAATNTWGAKAFPLGAVGDTVAFCPLADGTFLAVKTSTPAAGHTNIWTSVYSPGSGTWSAAVLQVSPAVPANQTDIYLLPLDGAQAMLLLGHEDNTPSVTTHIWIYTAGVLAAGPAPTTQRWNFGATSYTGSFTPGGNLGVAYLVGGNTNTLFPAATAPIIEQYNQAAGAWSTFDTLPTIGITAGMAQPICAYAGGRLWVQDQNASRSQGTSANQKSLVVFGSPTLDPRTAMVLDFKNPPPNPTTESQQLCDAYVWTLAGIEPFSACIHKGAYHTVDITGQVRKEVPDQWFDVVSGAEVSILPVIEFAPLSLDQLQGIERIYRVQPAGSWAGDADVKLIARVVTNDPANPAVFPKTATMRDYTLSTFEVKPAPQRMTQLLLKLQEVLGGLPKNLTRGYLLRSIGIEVGAKGKLRHLDIGQRP